MASKEPQVPDALMFRGTPYISLKCIKQVIKKSSNKAIKDFEKACPNNKATVKDMKQVVKAIIYTFDHLEEKED